MRTVRLAMMAVAALAALTLVACGGESDDHDANAVADIETTSDSPYRGGQVVPLEPAPAIDLRDVDGGPALHSAPQGTSGH